MQEQTELGKQDLWLDTVIQRLHLCGDKCKKNARMMMDGCIFVTHTQWIPQCPRATLGAAAGPLAAALAAWLPERSKTALPGSLRKFNNRAYNDDD